MGPDDRSPLPQTTQIDKLSVYRYGFALLGAPIVRVEADLEAQLESFLESAFETFSRFRPTLRWFSHPIQAGQTYFRPRADTVGYGITEVLVPRLDPIIPMLSTSPLIDVFAFRYGLAYRDLAEVFLEYNFYNMARQILSSDFKWRWIDGGIGFHPRPEEGFALTYCSAFQHDIVSFPRDHMDWLKKYVYALLQQAVGNARDKFPMIGGANSPQRTNGDRLVRSGEVLQEKLEAQAEQRAMRIPLLVG